MMFPLMLFVEIPAPPVEALPVKLMVWGFIVMWTITLILAGGLGTALYGKLANAVRSVDKVSDDIVEIRDDMAGMRTSAARIEAKLEGHDGRLTRVENDVDDMRSPHPFGRGGGRNG